MCWMYTLGLIMFIEPELQMIAGIMAAIEW